MSSEIAILVIDPTPVLEIIVKTCFPDHSILRVPDGITAIEMIRSHPEVGVLLCNCRRDKEVGIRSLLFGLNEYYPFLRSIIISPYKDLATIRNFMNLRAFDFLAKPVQSQDIALTVRKALRYVQQHREIYGRLQQSDETLHLQEAMYHVIVEHQYDLICRFSPSDGRLTFANRAWYWFFGEDWEEIYRRTFWEFFPHKKQSQLQELLVTLSPTNSNMTFESELRLSQTSTFWVQWQIVGIFDPEGTLWEYQAVGRDLTGYKQQLQTAAIERYRFGRLIGKSSAMQEVYMHITAAAETNATVLIIGETGTGKELAARTIYEKGSRQNKPFVVVNCSAIPEHLFESAFFGHRRGAFTGADQNTPGFFDAAHQGTLFLDEIGELPLNMQAKLLRAIDTGEFTLVGETELRQIDVRIIAATNQKLETLVQQGAFREDLFYRVKMLSLHLPPLRERREDIPLLIEHFLHQADYTEYPFPISGQIWTLWYQYDWPGNVRELEHEVQRYLSMRQFEKAKNIRQDKPRAWTLPEILSGFEKQYILEVLKQCKNNKTLAAKRLGIQRRTLHRKLRNLGLM